MGHGEEINDEKINCESQELVQADWLSGYDDLNHIIGIPLMRKYVLNGHYLSVLV